MRTVFRFSKGGAAQYISHLDLMRTMSRAVRRAAIPASYSQGFHPHLVMAYAQALGLGYKSQGEYMELNLDDSFDPGMAVLALNRALPEGLAITGAWHLDEKFPTLMAAVSAARWLVEFQDPVNEALIGQFKNLLTRDTIDVIKEGKNGSSHVDIRPGIYTIEGAHNGIELFLAAGSTLNIRPELVVLAALESLDQIRAMTRLELYTLVDDRHLPFDKICIGGELYEHGKDNIG